MPAARHTRKTSKAKTPQTATGRASKTPRRLVRHGSLFLFVHRGEMHQQHVLRGDGPFAHRRCFRRVLSFDSLG